MKGRPPGRRPPPCPRDNPGEEEEERGAEEEDELAGAPRTCGRGHSWVRSGFGFGRKEIEPTGKNEADCLGKKEIKDFLITQQRPEQKEKMQMGSIFLPRDVLRLYKWHCGTEC